MNSQPKIPSATTPTSDEKEDRLGSLPDDILCHILSFVSTKNSVMTSILSKRWKTLYLDVPNLDLDDFSNLMGRDLVKFIDKRLIRSTSSVTQFRMKVRLVPNARVLNLWLTALVSCNVKVVEVVQPIICFRCSFRQCPLIGIFRWQNIEVLKLGGKNIFLKIPEFVSFPNLKVLHLQRLELEIEFRSFRLAEEGYPMLEELRLDMIRFLNQKEREVIEISIPTLKLLAIVLRHPENGELRIDIDTPNLQHLHCIRIPDLQVTSWESLVSADIYCMFPAAQFTSLSSKISNVKKLSLSGIFLQGDSFYANSLPLFPNLIHLKLTAKTNGDSFWYLLHRAPNLQSIVCKVGGIIDFSAPENRPPCCAQNLREITLGDFTGAEAEMAVVGVLLEHGGVVERMTIKCLDEFEIGELANLKLLLLELKPQSSKCEISLVPLNPC